MDSMDASQSSQNSLDQENNLNKEKRMKFICKISLPEQEYFEEISKQQIFSAVQEISHQVVVSQKPVKSKLIENYFKKEMDFKNCKESFLGDVDTFYFDSVLNQYSSMDDLYHISCQPLVRDLFEDKNGTLFLFGSSRSGKTSACKGNDENNSGIAIKAIDDILT